ncbi:N-acylglucosamine 2-epimerase [Arthrobacter sp. Hiyo8]|nr:N-acylglucosamine 2-epimerase [Arthrobacter sp. Hiyo8]
MSATGSEIRDQLLKGVLPWWLENGVDRENGGVFTCFSNAGRLLSNEKYTWSQGRWAWLCSRIAFDSGDGIIAENPQLWAALSIETARFIQEHAILDGSVTAYRTSAEGQALPSGPQGEIAVSVLADLFAAWAWRVQPGFPKRLAANVTSGSNQPMRFSPTPKKESRPEGSVRALPRPRRIQGRGRADAAPECGRPTPFGLRLC